MDRGCIDRNRAALPRLKRTAESLSDADLAMRIENGWTVAVAFAHMAFWDRQRLELLRYWRDGGTVDFVYPGDAINAALLPLLQSVPPREAIRQAVTAAEAIHSYLDSLPDDFLTAVMSRPHPPNLERSKHWEHHLGQVDRALAHRQARARLP